MKRPRRYKGRFLRTDGNGNDWYAPDYYAIPEVEAYMEHLETLLRLAKCPDANCEDGAVVHRLYDPVENEINMSMEVCQWCAERDDTLGLDEEVTDNEET